MSEKLLTIDEIVGQVMKDNFATGNVLIPVDKIRQMMMQAAHRVNDAAMAKQVQVLRLRPGDLLVVHMPQEMDRANAARLTEEWSEVLKEFSATAVICNGVERFSILRSGSEAHDG